MIFKNLSILQNVLFLVACLGIILLITYLICLLAGFIHNKKNITSDDIDNSLEDFTEPRKFIYNAFTIKGSIIFTAIGASSAFALSIVLNQWTSLGIGVVVSFVLVILLACYERQPVELSGQIGVVTETIPEMPNDGTGKIILLTDGSEITAVSTGKTIKKGKKVVIIENLGNKVVVKKYKRVYKSE